jgi:AcrR family transcriptional regulator
VRADARRNYERLLAAARTAFAEHGVDASLDDIARSAGVGPGTLYRHFPTRHALLEKVLNEAQDALLAEAEKLATEPDPDAALLTWMRRLAGHSMTFRGLAEELVETMYDPESPLYGSCQALTMAGDELFVRAQKAGTIRADVSSADAFGMTCATAWVADHNPGAAAPTEIERMLDIIISGLRPR